MSKFHYVLCAIPVAVLVGVAFLGYQGSWLTLVALGLCPLAMIFMMRGMHDSSAGGHDRHAPAGSEPADQSRVG